MAGIRIYETAIHADWIDYNGHLQDAYYGLILSEAVDALMDRVGLDAAYRKRTGGTLYTLEMHIHFLREVKQSDTALVNLAIVGLDRKRIHAAFEILRAGEAAAAATAEIMLLHVHQDGATVRAAPFPSDVAARLAELEAASAAGAPIEPGSRRIELRAPAGSA